EAESHEHGDSPERECPTRVGGRRASESLGESHLPPPLHIVRFGSSGAYVMLRGHVKSSAHAGLLRRARHGRRGSDDLLRHETEGVAFGRLLLELPAL